MMNTSDLKKNVKEIIDGNVPKFQEIEDIYILLKEKPIINDELFCYAEYKDNTPNSWKNTKIKDISFEDKMIVLKDKKTNFEVVIWLTTDGYCVKMNELYLTYTDGNIWYDFRLIFKILEMIERTEDELARR